MKNIFYDREDLLPLKLLALAITALNFGIFMFNAISAITLVFLAFVHIFIIFEKKDKRGIPFSKILKYSAYCLLFNGAAYFAAVALAGAGFESAVSGFGYNFVKIGSRLTLACLLSLLLLSAFPLNTKKGKNMKNGNLVPPISTFVFVVFNVVMFFLTMNAVDLLVAIFVVSPCLYYVLNKLMRLENNEELSDQEQQ